MTDKHKELLYSIAAGWSVMFIFAWLFWWYAVGYVKPEDAAAWMLIFLVLTVAAFAGGGYLFWWLNKDEEENRK